MSLRHSFAIFIAGLLLVSLATPTSAQFGRNKVQYKDFKWHVLNTPHFDIHFYEGEEEFAVRAGLVMEDGYKMLSEKLNETLPWRVPVILYGSHNDFLQTNVILQLLPEGVQAFAEPSRKRIVMPFTSSFNAFAHTAIHELAHIFTYQIVFNRLLENVFSRNALFGMPLWMAEGVAEYLAVGWDAESDMYVRDGVVHDYIGDLNLAGGFFVYKQGQSVFNYIEDTYGKEKVVEIMRGLGSTRHPDGALERTIGLTTYELGQKWKKAMRKKYWPLVAEKTEAADIGRRITNHRTDRGYYNTQPVMSPDGETVAFFSDRDGLMSIYLASALDGHVIKKLVSGHRSNRFESLHFFTSRLAFSPDGDHITFVAKSKGRDRLFIIDVEKGRVRDRFDVESDGLASPTWSPDGKKICVSATFAGQTDLVIVDVESGKSRRLTNDPADQLKPHFFPDGKRVAYIHYPEVTIPVPAQDSADARRELSEMDFLADGNVQHGRTFDIYQFDIDTGIAVPLIATEGNDDGPAIFDGGKKMIFVSDVSGASNLYYADLERGEYRRITDVLGGLFSPDVNEEEERISFAAYVAGGFDVFVSDNLEALLEGSFDKPALIASNQQARAAPAKDVTTGPNIPVALLAKGMSPPATKQDVEEVFSLSDNDPKPKNDAEDVADEVSAADVNVLPRYTGDTGLGGGQGVVTSEKKDDAINTGADRRIEGVHNPVSGDEPITKGATVSNYRIRLAADYVGQGAGVQFSTGFGFGLANTIAMSDLLGNHRAVLSFNIFRDIASSDLLATYYYLKKRIDYGIGAFQFKNFLNSRVTSVGESFADYRLFSERNYGIFGLVSFPFSTFNRMDFELQAFVSERRFFEEEYIDPNTGEHVFLESGSSTRHLIEPSVSFVHDASFFGPFGPVDGSRYTITVSRGLGVDEAGVSRSTVYLDYRKYKLLFHRNSIAFRLAGAASEGDNPRRFFLGGPSTLRGYDYLGFEGSRMALFSAEYRFPLIDALIIGWPARWGLGNIGGSLFFDAGTVWDQADVKLFDGEGNGLQFRDVLGDFGVGMQMYLGYFLMNFQLAWRTDLQSVGGSQFYFYLGPTF